MKSSSPPLFACSSPAALPNQRAKSLGIDPHDSNLPAGVKRPRARKSESGVFDSAHFQAARKLRLAREAADLTQEQLAERAGENPRTVGRRERGEVALGPLRILVLLEREAEQKKGAK